MTRAERLILDKLEKIMGDLTALNAAITQLTTDVGTLITDASGTSDQAAIDAATSNVTALDAQVQAALAADAPPAAAAPAPAAPAAPAASASSTVTEGGVTVDSTGHTS